MGKGKTGHRLPLAIRILLVLIAAGAIIYIGTVIYVCIQERTVLSDVPSREEYDAIIVLGAQIKPDGSPSVQLEWRLDAAIQAYEKKNVPMVVCGAQGNNEPAAEAEVMEEYLSARGIPEDMILTDPESFNTRQNLKNASDLLAGLPGITKVMIVTSDYHLPRAMAIARDLGLEGGEIAPFQSDAALLRRIEQQRPFCVQAGGGRRIGAQVDQQQVAGG